MDALAPDPNTTNPVARTFSGGPESEKAARKLLLGARTHLNDRKAEIARIWMLSAAGVFALLALLVMLVVWLNRVALEQWFSPQMIEMVYGAGAAATGAKPSGSGGGGRS